MKRYPAECHYAVILLALMLVYLFAVVVYVCGRYYCARRAPGIESFGKATLAANLNIELGGLKSIAITAPYLGLVGTCEGILSAVWGHRDGEARCLGNDYGEIGPDTCSDCCGDPRGCSGNMFL
jgi:hypothetical protein